MKENYNDEGENVMNKNVTRYNKDRGYHSLLNPLLSLFDDGFSHDFSNNSSILKTDISENENGYLFEVEVPGIDKKDLSINLEKGYLEISVKTSKKLDSDNHKRIHSERFYGSYSRSYFVGYDVKKSDISAKLDNGVLNLSVKKPIEEKENNSIEIE